MKYIYTFLVAVVLALVVIFAFQNLRAVTVVFFDLQVRLPLWLLIIAIYFLGMLTGSFVSTSIRKWVRGASRR